MVRRAPSAATDDSHKENTGVRSTRNKMPEVKKEKAKSRAARVESDEEDDGPILNHFEEEKEEYIEDDDEEEEEEEEEDGSSPKGRKRARANSFGDSLPSGSQAKGKVKPEVKTLPRDEDGFIPGSIVRVQLRNFVTYDWVEFTPGPYLNMILGPNGTGKSSIACAICLGLNFPPSVLGRASDLNAFVKLGMDDGHIEIELKGAKGKPNLVIRRTLSAHTKSNHFTLNGKAASGREINLRMQELNVQVSNLCSFLPQDKVAEFARMTPQQLLKETQRAAGNENLTSWHETLISAGAELKTMQNTADEDRKTLQTMEERNANLEREVKRFEERQEKEAKIEFLELVVPFKEYTEAKIRYSEIKNRQRAQTQAVHKLQKKMAPVQELKNQLERQHRELESRREAKKTTTKNKFAQMKRKWEQSEKLEQESEELKNKLDGLKKAEKERQKNIHNLEKEISIIQEKVDHPPKFEDVSGLEEEIRQLKSESRKFDDRLSDLQERQRGVVREEADYKARIQDAQHRLKQQDDVDHRKLDHLTRWDRDCAEVVRWLRANRHRFKMEVFDPPVLSLTVPDKRFINAIESCFSQNDLKTFVCQCEEDYQTLNRLVVDTPEALGHKARINTFYRKQTGVNPPPVPEQQLPELGFDGYALQYIQCPDGMVWFLQNALSLHRTPIALNPGRVDAARAMDALSRDGGINYIVGNIFNAVRRSKYGKRLAQNSTREIQQARNLVATAIDPAVKQEIDRVMHEAQEGVRQCEVRMAALSEEDRQLRADHKDSKNKYEIIFARKSAISKEKADFEKLKLRLQSQKARLQRLLEVPSADAERASLKTKILEKARQRMNIVKEYEALLRQAIAEQVECTKLGLEYLQVSAKKTALDVLYRTQQEEVDRASAIWREVNDAYSAAKVDSKAKLRTSKEKLDAAKPEMRDKFQTDETGGALDDGRSAQDVQGELDQLKAELEMNMHTNAGVVDQYRKRQIEIANLSQKIEDRDEKIQKLEHRIKSTRDKWEPALMRLVDSIGEKFSSAFDRIGCAGEIKVSRDADYDKWAIDILVKFRDDEKLQLLTGERQSGGERSLTTILYLMSLTEHARAPFSLVDEINQGMDQKAERAVHNSLVEVTCKPDSGQYFLITPKLLPDLNYHERMKVLCVNNGEWLPEEKTSGSLMSMIDTYIRTKGTRPAAA
ncbi:hypothetical protein PHLCEN_2v7446 [Hermanssonia centrifuga]|uniref:Structural maintenance of chromosomes protein 5 n=1 Tax=Hermanssonia centrifuga TaxID=98765 RepID=A0A2R6NWJ1_9APHY|nr:hypothetical protein PHLCEN_2v7446 [Hermanssonia centrifuga]